MTDSRYGDAQLFQAFIKSAQYLARIKRQEDVWDQIGKLLMTCFPAAWIAFAERDSTNGISIHYCTLPDALAAQRILTDEARSLITDVLDSGFLASQVICIPDASMTAFLPIVEEYSTEKVMLIGHSGANPLPNDLLNIYLAIASLAGTTFERVQNERELNQHRDHLEELVKERTAEINRLNESLSQRAADLEASNKELEAFSYSVSHDLRTPLRAIDGFSQAVIEDYADKLDEQGRAYLQVVRQETQRMAELIDDILNLSRVTRSEMHREPVDLSDLARTVAEGLRGREPKRQVQFEIEPGLVVNGDARLLRVVMENLLGNAWKFTSKHATARIQFGLSEQAGGKTYFVRDDGAGFDMAYADQLFGAFQRLHGQGEYAGTGIGLATVQRIVRRHGGRIWAEAKLEQGAVFYFTLE